ncbi:MAG: alpha/beta hydrolase [Candidatus Doudnabacteria bacterium]|nr:alpha/beta hydrolase [Candidatus Doudnabacteria bacterium]
MPEQIIVKGNLISYNQYGAGDCAVIFLHGWRSNKEVWNGVVNEVIRLSSYQVYAIDLPGFGSSSAPKEPWRVGDYAEIIKGFVEQKELQAIIIVGHSFGGRVGIKLAAKYPSLVSKLILVDAAGFTNAAAKKNVMGFAAKIVKPLFRPKFMQGLRKSIYKIIGAEDYVATPNLQQTFVNTINEDLSAEMEKIICPTLIITGENDKDTPVEYGQKMKNIIHNSKFIILSGAGHFSFLDQPEDFAKVLTEFI